MRAIFSTSNGQMNNQPITAGSKNNWIYGLDSIRFVLALIVLLSHLPNTFVNSATHKSTISQILITINHQMFCGPAAVITFFILSGFVIHFPNRHKEKFDVASYLVRRIFRIGIPLLIVVLIAIHFNLFNRVPVWSLYCELFYYVIYPVLFWIKVSWRKKLIVSFVVAFVIVISLDVNIFTAILTHSNNGYKFELWELGVLPTFFIGLPAWLIGVVLANKIDTLQYEVKFKSLLFYRFLVYSTSCALLVAAFHFHISYIISLNIFALFAVKWIEKEIVYYRNHNTNRIFEFLGRISYSIYLIHGLLITFLSLYIVHKAWSYPLYVLIPILISLILYYLVELPSHKLALYLSKKINSPTRGVHG